MTTVYYIVISVMKAEMIKTSKQTHVQSTCVKPRLRKNRAVDDWGGTISSQMDSLFRAKPSAAQGFTDAELAFCLYNQYTSEYRVPRTNGNQLNYMLLLASNSSSFLGRSGWEHRSAGPMWKNG